jgi:hypothetical protein
MRHAAVALVLLVALSAVAAYAQANKADIVLGFDFENSSKPWDTMDKQGQLGLTADAEHVREGTSSLEFKYNQRTFEQAGQQGSIPGAVGVPMEGGIVGAKTMHFSIRAARQTAIVVSLGETNDANYQTPIWVPANQWVDVDLPMTAFVLERNKPDPDGRLDLDQVRALTFIDAAPFFYMLAESGMIPLAKQTLGEQTVWLDNVRFLSTALPEEKPAKPVADGQAVVIDTCRHHFSQWPCLGTQTLAVSESPGNGGEPGLKVSYTTPAGTIVPMMRAIAHDQLAGTKRLEFDAKVAVDTMLMVGVEQDIEPKPAQGDGKARFMTQVQLKAADGWKRIAVPYTEMKQDQNEAPTAMSPAMFSGLIVADMTGMATAQPVTNTLQLDDVVAVK